MRVDGVLSDVTESQRSQEELVARNRELMTLYRISEITLSAPSGERAYEDVLEELCRATGFPIAAIEEYDPQRNLLIIRGARGLPLEGGSLDIPVDETPSGIAVRTGQPVVTTNVRARPDMANEVLRSLGIQTWMSFPLIDRTADRGHARPGPP